MSATLASRDDLLGSDWLHPIDRHFSGLMRRLAGRDAPGLALAAALASRQLADGHSCVCLADFAGRPLPGGKASGPAIVCPPLEQWEESLRANALVGGPGEFKPLILDGSGRLYLHRYWQYEQAIAQDLRQRCQQPPFDLDREAIRYSLKQLFPAANPEPNWQKIAAFTAVRQPFSIITGGPGTGKTWAIAAVLAVLLDQPGSETLSIRLAAPTGKAAARLQESLARSLDQLACAPEVKGRLQAMGLGTTIHRLLEANPRSAGFRYHRDHPLPAQVLVIDEASMVSLSLMARLLAAFGKCGTRLVLVGDKDQLPSVDPGAVLGDLGRAASVNRFSSPFVEEYRRCTGETLDAAGDAGGPAGNPLRDAVVQLQVNYRSGDAAVLNSVSARVNAGDHVKVCRLLQEAGPGGSPIAWQSPHEPPHRPLRDGAQGEARSLDSGGQRASPRPEGAPPDPLAIRKAIRDLVAEHYAPALEAASPEKAIESLSRFRILCAVREGPFGWIALNRAVEAVLAEALPHLAPRIRLGAYPGKPVMVTANNYALLLYNGDTGVCWTADNGASLFHFPDEKGRLRAIARERLPECETAYAMTIHKSQGSEFDHVLIVLPDADSPLLTRELVYTGLTRAKKSARLLCGQALLSEAIQRTAQRRSGLAEALGALPGCKPLAEP
ncbi:MAG TPA: exodeoxyribonuclease V subunit alpha [Candidatus Paceibacterota bacterium]|nr:exodeoxyribonuclease V subunit alpha [Candidatus Paceibacterota bacterium]HRZ92999.1 exodeoxyribonuclease V subunit alpha [Candidatus Paceibacterota bacterium]